MFLCDFRVTKLQFEELVSIDRDKPYIHFRVLTDQLIPTRQEKLTCDMNFLSISCFFSSSLVGSPICFWRWSNIIFSTIALVSVSKSLSFEFSGSICVVSISGWWVTMFFHHSIRFIFSRWITKSSWSSGFYQLWCFTNRNYRASTYSPPKRPCGETRPEIAVRWHTGTRFNTSKITVSLCWTLMRSGVKLILISLALLPFGSTYVISTSERDCFHV